MKPMARWKHAIAYITLGLLCGWYYFIILLYPTLIFSAFQGSYLAGSIFAIFIALTISPLKFKPWQPFLNTRIWAIWREYFDFTFDDETLKKNFKHEQKYFFFEFPHGVFPMGQFVSASVIDQITPGKFICGTGADIIFSFPIMRQVMAWIGTVPAGRKNIAKVFEAGHNCAIIPGGIAEMYLMNRQKESIFLRKRINTVKIAIQQGAHIVPAFFFGNTLIFDIAGNSGSSSFMSQLSRRLRASILFFYGRHYLPVPYRHPLRMALGEIVEVVQKDEPSDAEAQAVLDRVVASIEKLYATKKPDWETRPLTIE